MTGQVPFKQLTTVAVMLAVAYQGRIPEKPSETLVPNALWDIWTTCWFREPSSRPTMTALSTKMEQFARLSTFDSTTPLPKEPSDDDEEELDHFMRRTTLVERTDIPRAPSFTGAALDYDYKALWNYLSSIQEHPPLTYKSLDGIANWTGWLVMKEAHPLGHGGYNDVFLAHWVNLPEGCDMPPLATIRVRRASGFSANGAARAAKAVSRELHIWKDLNHRNILPLIGVVVLTDGFPSLVSPFMENGTAEIYFRRNRNVPRKAVFLLELAEAILYLHSQEPPLIHGIITPSTVLVDEHVRPRLTGFSLIRSRDEGTMHPSRVMAFQESPPEMFDTKVRARRAAPGDVYMYAMTSVVSLR